MLVLTRKLNQKIHIGEDVILTILEIRGNRIRVGIEAPNDVRVLRAELDLVAEPVESASHEQETVF